LFTAYTISPGYVDKASHAHWSSVFVTCIIVLRASFVRRRSAPFVALTTCQDTSPSSTLDHLCAVSGHEPQPSDLCDRRSSLEQRIPSHPPPPNLPLSANKSPRWANQTTLFKTVSSRNLSPNAMRSGTTTPNSSPGQSHTARSSPSKRRLSPMVRSTRTGRGFPTARSALPTIVSTAMSRREMGTGWL